MWIEKQELRNEIENYQLSGQASERLGELLLGLADGLARRYAYGLEHEEAVADGVCHLLTAILNYNPHKANALNYVTTILVNHFRYLKRRKQYRNVLRSHLVYQNGGADYRPAIPEYKICIGCDEMKSKDHFRRDYIRGLNPKCKSCNAQKKC